MVETFEELTLVDLGPDNVARLEDFQAEVSNLACTLDAIIRGEVESEFGIFTISELAEALFDQVILGIHLRETDTDNGNTNEAFSNEINALAEDTTEHCEA